MARTPIVPIMTDQHALHAIGCYGAKICRTPNIDALAAGGVRFTSARTPCALRAPARGGSTSWGARSRPEPSAPGNETKRAPIMSRRMDRREALRRIVGAGKADPPERKWYSYWAQNSEQNERLAVISGPWKLVREGPPILSPPGGGAEAKGRGAKLYLFRIDDDPNEKTNLAAQHGDIVQALLKDLKAFRALRHKKGLPPYGHGRKGFKAPKDWTMPAR